MVILTSANDEILYIFFQVDGKLLCWLCTLSYKRALAKTKQSVQDRREHQRLTREREREAKRREQAGR